MIEATAKSRYHLTCSACDCDVYLCNECEDYIKEGDVIVCDEDSTYHAHESCYESKTVKNESHTTPPQVVNPDGRGMDDG